MGFQRTSKTSNFLKEWSIENTQDLIKKCHMENICLINLSADEYKHEKYPYSLHDVDIFQIVDYLYNMDLFIGIDSFFGHLSAILSIPSISIFEFTNSSFPQFEVCAEKFLPIGKNYALIAKYFRPNRISSEKIYAVMMQVLLGEKSMNEKYVSMIDKYRRYPL